MAQFTVAIDSIVTIIIVYLSEFNIENRMLCYLTLSNFACNSSHVSNEINSYKIPTKRSRKILI